MNPDNLTAVYNQNPTIQSMYTLPEYLSLFNQGTYTPIQPTPTDPTPTDPTPEPGIPSIINQNLNQGGGEGDGNNTISSKDYGYKSSFAQDNKVQGPQTKEEIEGFLNDIGEGTIDDDDLSFGLSLKEGLYSLQNAFKNLPTPLNLARKGIEAFNDYQEKKAKEREIEKERIEKEKAAEETKKRNEQIEANNRISQQQQAALNAAYQRQTQRQREAGGGGGGQFDGASSKGEYDSDPTGFSGSFARGGRVRRSYFNGGIVSLRRR